MIVVDASVIAKCFIVEPDSRQAVALLDRHPKFLAPSLIRQEVAAAICRHARLGHIAAEEAKAKCQNWFQLLQTDVLELTPDGELLDEAIHLAVTIKHPLQDCLYLEVMRRHGDTLVTADRKFHDRVSPIYPGVKLLADSATSTNGKRHGSR